jgi:hypothetical protein
MDLFETIDEDNFVLYGAKHYHKNTFVDMEEFHEDLKRFNYLRRLVNRYVNNDQLSERLMLNHLIIIFNVFGIKPGLRMLEYKISAEHWHIIKPFLILLKTIKNHEYPLVGMDDKVVTRLREL